MKRLLAFIACLLLCAAAGAAPQKVLRYAFQIAETSLDPVRIQDSYSRILTSHIFEAPLRYDHLARPVRLRPLTAESMPEHSADFRVWTVPTGCASIWSP
jgi:ABC-type oligopeptide transport system substrate-binding subunit